jgi:hypothetical protein
MTGCSRAAIRTGPDCGILVGRGEESTASGMKRIVEDLSPAMKA